MKIILNQKTLEKMKDSKGKMKLTVASVALATGLSAVALTGCTSTPVVEVPSEVTTEVQTPSEEVSEVVVEPSEEVSEVVSEEPSEEVVEETYTAEDAIALIDELTAKYQYDAPETIQALVIGANQYSLAEGELQKLLDNYGYTIDGLNESFCDNFHSTYDSIYSTSMHYMGSSAQVDLPDEINYKKRVTLEDVTLNSIDKEYAISIDKEILDCATASGYAENLKSDTEYQMFVEVYVNLVCHGRFDKGPYADIENVNVR